MIEAEAVLIPAPRPEEPTTLEVVVDSKNPATNWSLIVLAVIASATALYFAKVFFVPVVLAILFQILLSPIVRAAERFGVLPPVSATALMLGLALAIGLSIYFFANPAQEWLSKLPNQVSELRSELSGAMHSVEKVTEAARAVDEMTTMNPGTSDPKIVKVAPVEAGSPLLNGTTSFVAQGFITMVLLYALIAGHESFLRSLVTILPRLRDKKLAVEIVRGIYGDVSHYLMTITVINACLGVAIGATLWAIGLPNPFLWGLMAMVFNYVPYAGAIAGVGITGLVAASTFDGPTRPLLAMGSYAVLTTLEGGILTPLILGRRLRIRSMVLLTWLLFWSYLWGLVGTLIAVPLLVAFKILCDHLPSLQGIGVFLGQQEPPVHPPAAEVEPAAS